MLIIRLLRVGKKNQPAFKIVVTDKRKSATKGIYVEEVGFWNPLTKEKVLKQERIKYWLSVGAKPSATIHNLLISEKIVEGNKIPVHKKKKVKEGSAEAEKIEAPVAKAEVPPVAETPKKEEPKAEISKEETPAPEPTQKEESKPEPPKKEEPFEEDKFSSRPSPSEEGSGAEEKLAENKPAEGKTPRKPAETSRPEAPEEEEKEKAEPLIEIK